MSVVILLFAGVFGVGLVLILKARSEYLAAGREFDASYRMPKVIVLINDDLSIQAIAIENCQNFSATDLPILCFTLSQERVVKEFEPSPSLMKEVNELLKIQMANAEDFKIYVTPPWVSNVARTI